MSKRPNELTLDFLAVVGKEAAREAAETARRAGIPVAGFDAPTVSDGIFNDAGWTNIRHGKTQENVKLPPTAEQSTILKNVRSKTSSS